jgi:serine/threonine-protein kinase
MNIGVRLFCLGKLDEAIAEHRLALKFRTDYALAHSNLGVALSEQGKLDEAMAEHCEALRLKPKEPWVHYNLAIALLYQGKLEEAIAECRSELRLNSNIPSMCGEVGVILRRMGEFAEAIGAFRKGRELARTNPALVSQFDRELTATEQLAPLAPRLAAVVAGKLEPGDATEMLGFAQLCSWRQLHGASARLSAEAFRAAPRLADDMNTQNRYNAACAAALAGCGQGKDNPPLDDPTKARWRKQALDWLKADLAAWSRLLQTGPPQARESIAKTLQHWKADPDLASLRDPTAVAKLPPDEQHTCRALWAKVDARLTKTAGATP